MHEGKPAKMTSTQKGEHAIITASVVREEVSDIL